MKSDAPLDYAVFQLSPRRTRCDLFVSSARNTEKLASGLLKPFLMHLKVADEQVALAVQSIKLDVDRHKNAQTWFTKGTLERFVRFVSTPEILELVNTFDAEMSQLEAAQRIYSQGMGDQFSGSFGVGGVGAIAAADATKKELLRAIDVQLSAVRQDLVTSCSRAAAAGFTPDTVSELQPFAERFGASRLNEACSKYVSLCERRPDLIKPWIRLWKVGVEDGAVRSSYGSDTSLDEDRNEQQRSGSYEPRPHHRVDKRPTGPGSDLTQQRNLGPSGPSTLHQPKPSSVAFPLRRSGESNIERDDVGDTQGSIEREKPEESVGQTESSHTARPARRLSVQDRISLFENKQKENSGGGGKLVVVKSVDNRRLSSDASSPQPVAEKTVLRRWSGASDMSLDSSGEKKENESLPCTALSSLASYSWSDVQKGLCDTATSGKLKLESIVSRVGESGLIDRAKPQALVGVTYCEEEVVGLKVGVNAGGQLLVSSVGSGDNSESHKVPTLGEVENDSSKDKLHGKIQSQSSFGRNDCSSLRDQATSQIECNPFPGGRAQKIGWTDQGKFRAALGGDKQGAIDEQVASETQVAGMKHPATPQSQSGAFANMQSDSNSGVSHEPLQSELNNVQDVRLRNDSVSQSRFRAPVRTARDSQRLKGTSGVKTREASASRYKGANSDLSASLPQWRSLGDEEARKKDLLSSEKQVEESGPQRKEFRKQMPTLEQIKKLQDRKDEKSSDYRSGKTIFSDLMVSEGQEGLGSIPIAPVEQVQRVRQLKGNQELNNELRMKAEELEKLFAEHKLRVPGDQSTSTCRGKATGVQVKQGANLLYRKTAADIAYGQTESAGISGNVVSFDACSLVKMVDNQDDDLKQNSSDLGILDDPRGKLYNKYMQIRDAKLSKEWASKREQKEAKLKAMQDKLEWSRAEMKAKFSGTVDRQDSLFNTRQHAERLGSFNIQSNTKQQPLDFVQSEGDDDLSEFSEQIPFGPTRSFCATSLEDDTCRSTQSKKLLPNRNLSSSTPHSLAAPVPRSAVKASNSTSGRRRMQSENPLAQSVPKFSDFRKENTKPSSGLIKTTTFPKLKSNARSKRSTEETSLVKDEKPHLSQSLRKTSANPAEFKDLSLISEGIVLKPLDFDKEQTEKNPNYRFTDNMEAKTSLRKGNGIGCDSGADIAKLKASMSSDTMSNEDEFGEFIFEPEDSMDVIEDEEEEELKAMANQGHKLTLGQESDKLVNSGSKNGDALRSFSQANPSLVTDLPAAMPSTSQPVGSTHDSPGESPVSWNSHMNNPFSYPNETSDIDASADSPTGSPSSLNSHSLNQTEADVARMRKKWGSAQKPTLVANSSHNQSRRDVTKGFKRLLQFGRKARGTESLVDWISAMTSEGDDDTEDGRDLANRSSEDLRKSRRGFSQGHPNDCFNESEFLSEQVQALNSSIPTPPANFKLREDHFSGTSIKAPRSFFSLSSFRSKGSDSKPR